MWQWLVMWSTACWSWPHLHLGVSLICHLCMRLMVVHWGQGRSNLEDSVVGFGIRFLFLVFVDPHSRVDLSFSVMLVSRREAASVQNGRHGVRRGSDSMLRSSHTGRSWLCLAFLYSLKIAEERVRNVVVIAVVPWLQEMLLCQRMRNTTESNSRRSKHSEPCLRRKVGMV